MFAVWGIVGFAFFVFVQTKFRHYVLPAVPALAVIAALWLDDVWEGKVPGAAYAVGAALFLFLVTSVDLVTRQERLVNLMIFRYDRPWPYAPPWSLDFSGAILGFAALFGLGLLALLRTAWRRKAIVYYGPHELVRDWSSGTDLEVRSVIPQTLHEGDPMTVTWELRNANEGVQEKGDLKGTVASIDAPHHRFTIAIPPAERDKIAPVVAQNRGADDDQRRWLYVNAARMIGWQLNWKGENIYSGGEIWNTRIPDMMSCFSGFYDDNDKKLLEYLRPRIGRSRSFWVVTEIGSLGRLKNLLPTDTAKETLDTPDHSSNKFGMAHFTLDHGESSATKPVID